MQVRTRNIATSLATLLVLASPAALLAQAAPLATLARVDSLIAAGQTQQARATLDEWKKDNAPDARSAYLAARLATRAQDAEDAYLDVALNFSSSPFAAESLLRLGQARIAAGDSKQAAAYLQRVISDYPKSEHRTTAQEWLTRTQPVAAVQSPAPAPPQPRVRNVPPSPSPPPSPVPSPSLAHFSVQVGAFREMTGARSVARQLEQSGFKDVRLVTIPNNTLIRVRVGKFETSAASSAVATKLKAAGFPAAPVSGVQNEQPVSD